MSTIPIKSTIFSKRNPSDPFLGFPDDVRRICFYWNSRRSLATVRTIARYERYDINHQITSKAFVRARRLVLDALEYHDRKTIIFSINYYSRFISRFAEALHRKATRLPYWGLRVPLDEFFKFRPDTKRKLKNMPFKTHPWKGIGCWFNESLKGEEYLWERYFVKTEPPTPNEAHIFSLLRCVWWYLVIDQETREVDPNNTLLQFYRRYVPAIHDHFLEESSKVIWNILRKKGRENLLNNDFHLQEFLIQLVRMGSRKWDHLFRAYHLKDVKLIEKALDNLPEYSESSPEVNVKQGKVNVQDPEKS